MGPITRVELYSTQYTIAEVAESLIMLVRRSRASYIQPILTVFFYPYCRRHAAREEPRFLRRRYDDRRAGEVVEPLELLHERVHRRARRLHEQQPENLGQHTYNSSDALAQSIRARVHPLRTVLTSPRSYLVSDRAS